MQVTVSLQADLSWLQKEKAMRQIISKEAANIFILLKKKEKKRGGRRKRKAKWTTFLYMFFANVCIFQAGSNMSL